MRILIIVNSLLIGCNCNALTLSEKQDIYETTLSSCIATGLSATYCNCISKAAGNEQIRQTENLLLTFDKSLGEEYYRTLLKQIAFEAFDLAQDVCGKPEEKKEVESTPEEENAGRILYAHHRNCMSILSDPNICDCVAKKAMTIHIKQTDILERYYKTSKDVEHYNTRMEMIPYESYLKAVEECTISEN